MNVGRPAGPPLGPGPRPLGPPLRAPLGPPTRPGGPPVQLNGPNRPMGPPTGLINGVKPMNGPMRPPGPPSMNKPPTMNGGSGTVQEVSAMGPTTNGPGGLIHSASQPSALGQNPTTTINGGRGLPTSQSLKNLGPSGLAPPSLSPGGPPRSSPVPTAGPGAPRASTPLANAGGLAAPPVSPFLPPTSHPTTSSASFPSPLGPSSGPPLGPSRPSVGLSGPSGPAGGPRASVGPTGPRPPGGGAPPQPWFAHPNLVPGTQQPQTLSQQPPISSQQPPISSQQPPISSQQPPISSQQPPISSQQPPISSQQPPISSQQPPISSHQPPTSFQQPPASSQPGPPLSRSSGFPTVNGIAPVGPGPQGPPQVGPGPPVSSVYGGGPRPLIGQPHVSGGQPVYPGGPSNGPPTNGGPPSMMGLPATGPGPLPPTSRPSQPGMPPMFRPPQIGGAMPAMGPAPPMGGGGHPMGSGPPPIGSGPPSMGNYPPVSGMPPMPNANGPMPPMVGGAPPMGNYPPVSGMPPMPNANGPMPPMPNANGPMGNYPPVSGMPPMPNANGPMPPMPGPNRFGGDMSGLSNKLGGLSVTNQGYQKMMGNESLDLLQNRHILPPEEVVPPKPKLQTESWNSINCSKDIFRCTLSKIPETDALLKKARLPLGVLIHPYKDLSHLPVIQCSTIVRCRSCRTYINPFVHFVDQRRWRCNLCYRVNELPEEFLYDPVSKTYGDPSRRPECKSATIEFIAPQEYMLRPPQPAVYLFLLDVSRPALECGYLRNFCDILLDELDKLPGDSRTQVGFITFDRTLQFYQIPEGAAQASQLVVGDIDDIFLPSPSDLLINLQSCKEQISEMLTELPELFNGSQETDSCLGAALQAAYKMISPTGGRITVLQSTLANIGPGALKNREGAQLKDGSNDTSLLGPSTDFYKKLALECSGQQIAVDLFVLNNQHVDLASISGISKFSGGSVETFPGYHNHLNPAMAEKFDRTFRRYLTRKIGFESVMRIRCTRGMSLHTFHGHFFVRSTDLLSLPNVNPDSGFGMQVSIDDDLRDSREVSFQAALLYTSSKGERRIRVHTLCVPISSSLQDIIQGADQQCIVGLLSKMAVDRSLNSSLSDAKEAFINACVDTISRWKMVQCISQPGVLPVSASLRLLPLYILALLKSPAFTARSGVKLDERTASLTEMKCLPLTPLIQSIYPDLYRVDTLDIAKTQEDEEGTVVPLPDRLQLSAENVSLSGAYLLDRGDSFLLYLGKLAPQFFCEKIFGVGHVTDVDENLLDLPELENQDSERLRGFIHHLNSSKSHNVPVKIIRDDGKQRMQFINYLIDDRSESSFSYYEFLQHLKTQIK